MTWHSRYRHTIQWGLTHAPAHYSTEAEKETWVVSWLLGHKHFDALEEFLDRIARQAQVADRATKQFMKAQREAGRSDV